MPVFIVRQFSRHSPCYSSVRAAEGGDLLLFMIEIKTAMNKRSQPAASISVKK